jgi:hypothetical protein
MLSATSTNWLCWIKTVSNRLWSKWGKGGGGPCQTFTTTHHTTGCHKTRKPILAKKIGVLVTNTWNKSTLKSRGTVKSVLYYQNVLTVSRHTHTHTHTYCMNIISFTIPRKSTAVSYNWSTASRADHMYLTSPKIRRQIWKTRAVTEPAPAPIFTTHLLRTFCEELCRISWIQKRFRRWYKVMGTMLEMVST